MPFKYEKKKGGFRHWSLYHVLLLICSMQLLLGCFCLGFVTSYVPKTIIDAYLTAAALHVIVSQFAFIFDVALDFHEGPLGIFYVSKFIVSQRNTCFLEVGSKKNNFRNGRQLPSKPIAEGCLYKPQLQFTSPSCCLEQCMKLIVWRARRKICMHILNYLRMPTIVAEHKLEEKLPFPSIDRHGQAIGLTISLLYLTETQESPS